MIMGGPARPAVARSGPVARDTPEPMAGLLLAPDAQQSEGVACRNSGTSCALTLDDEKRVKEWHNYPEMGFLPSDWGDQH